MLNLQPPYLDVGNLRIYTDESNKNVYYYINQKPRLCFNDEGKPALSAYAVIPESGIGKKNDSILETGLSIDLDLAVTDEEIEAAREAIIANFKYPAKTLSPAPLHKGVVKLFMSQKEGSENSKNWYVSSGFSPSMIGTNRVSLAIRTTGEDAKQLVAALSNNQIMANVSYDLEVVGITPVYKAYMKADMQQVYHHVDKKTSENYIFYKKEIENIVEELQESHALTIEIEEQDPEIKADAMKALLNELKSEVIKLFFSENKLISKSVSADGIADAIVGFTTSLVNSITPGYSYSKKVVDETQLKTFEINLRQKNAKTFPVSPQGRLKEIIDSAGINIDDYLSWIRLEDLEVKGQTVTIALDSETFNNSPIKSVVTYCRVIDANTGEVVKEPETIVFGRDDIETKKTLSTSFTYTRYREKQYRYEYWSNIYLDTIPGLLKSPLTTKVVSTDSNHVIINPADYFENFVIDLRLPNLDVLDMADMILARLNVYSGELDDQTIISKDFLFDKTHSSNQILTVLTERDMNLKYKVDFTYIIPNSKDVSMHVEEEQVSSIFLIPNPFENKWTTMMSCSGDWEKVDKIIVETRLHDNLREGPISNVFTFSEDHSDDILNVACSYELAKEPLEYYYWIYYKDGSQAEGGWIQSDDLNLIAINFNSLKSERTIQVKLKNPDYFKENDVGEIKISFYSTKDAEPIVKTIIKSDGIASFTYPWKKGDEKIYYYKFTAKDRDKNVIIKSSKIADDSNELLLELVEN